MAPQFPSSALIPNIEKENLCKDMQTHAYAKKERSDYEARRKRRCHETEAAMNHLHQRCNSADEGPSWKSPTLIENFQISATKIDVT